MEMKEMMKSISDKLSEHLNTSIVFGESREIKDKILIPVSAIAFGFGFGSGEKNGKGKKGKSIPETESPDIPKDEELKKNISLKSGGGGGGGGKAMPLGMFEITQERTRFIPVISAKHIIVLFGMLTALILKMHHKRNCIKTEYNEKKN
jgi:uncharacterized spore protein YtfJ